MFLETKIVFSMITEENEMAKNKFLISKTRRNSKPMNGNQQLIFRHLIFFGNH